MARLMLFLISSLGILIFVMATAVAPFKSKVFSILYAKPLSQASEGSGIPGVELVIEGIPEKKINADQGTSLTLRWKTANVKSCIGRSFGISEKDISWSGEKDPEGGTFQTIPLTHNNVYVYTIDCANEFGDASGDAIVVNVGAPLLSQVPYITSFEITKDKLENSEKPVIFTPGDEIQVKWSGLNLNTPYSICFASGSWPSMYQNSGKTNVSENFVLGSTKVYRYSLYCSNEAGITGRAVTFSPNP
ncbi:hypothetical protein A3F00_04145 [Candidatus Daviesbacteria bacterium RIFCSPHIGHO2_12_FULL_37_11]|uniref:Uncharacterized protein n=1 Tax=Candidatus Daviesbacteria bacterium RIFCSPHIGHO2_12_FULL_37_11 TaxID=1797777 RepID=A0A1F5KEG1_9BACT|nr:MAG: hypothetical protein A2111_00620 [Candidatus Daviesbacteria bacterium GWA1_38_6]OGE18131.1 MAG: hypothetical protein A2769_02700 [Candidatus Daviesbacteria bacterium RIFCSPHIGHO2_01_FULL_37_27]OGE39249.1 MAG: hypothetical protein A3F00_04145 [Candidatus Daviesbacteria bacterium RIFCSPHIGHO2_12_FULL_37_11]OGE45633.1 MAG: hypothetical protein A3B39_00575 [Candidatus Daviesbacteria bacterium RIFCSPLOWO2_01_FULL_37_10]